MIGSQNERIRNDKIIIIRKEEKRWKITRG